jgi:CHASE2 domain-containing sensor protein
MTAGGGVLAATVARDALLSGGTRLAIAGALLGAAAISGALAWRRASRSGNTRRPGLMAGLLLGVATGSALLLVVYFVIPLLARGTG